MSTKNLLIDIGNTAVKVASCAASAGFGNTAGSHANCVLSASFLTPNGSLIAKSFLKPLSSEAISYINKQLDEADKAILCSVADIPEGIDPKNPKFVDWNNLQLPFGFEPSSRAASTGKDRIAIAMGLRATLGTQDAIGIGIGSCVSYNVLSQNKFYALSLSPGLQMRLKAMHNYTKALPLIELEENTNLQNLEKISSTKTSMIDGCLRGMQYEILGYIESLRKDFGNIPTILCGGDCLRFEISTKNKIFAEPNLVLIGLNEILHQHCQI